MRRLPILLLPVALLAAAPACTDTDSMPTRPDAPAAIGPWTLAYAPFALDDLDAVWAMDVDDAWFGGFGGLLLHWNGRTLERHETDNRNTIRDIDGCATDEVWSVGDSTIRRWDGRRWTALTDDWHYDFRAVLCEAPDRVFVGGTARPFWDGRHGLVRRYTGRGWKDYLLPAPDTRVLDLWRPHADGPLFAVVQDTMRHAYVLDDGRWERLDWPGEPMDADGDLVMIDTGETESPISLYRVEPDHSLTMVCEAFAGQRVLQSKGTLACFDRGLQLVIDCARRTVLEAVPDDIIEYAVPVRPGASSPAILAAGRSASILICAWQPDWTMTWRALSPLDSYRLYGPVIGNGEQVFLAAWSAVASGVFVLEQGRWRFEPLEYRPAGMRLLANGDLLTWSRTWGESGFGEVHRRDAGGAWHALPPTGRYLTNLWGSTEDDLVAMTGAGTVLRLVGDEWRPQDSLGGTCDWFDGSAADNLFATIDVPRLAYRRLLRYDGRIWRDVTPADSDGVDECSLGAHTGTLYTSFWADGGKVLRGYLDGEWRDIPGDDFYPDAARLRESGDGYLYRSHDRSILRLHDGRWKPVYEAEDGFFDFDVHPDTGVHIVDNDSRVHHHSYRPR